MKTAGKPYRTGKPYTGREITRLWRMKNAGRTNRQIGQALGRSAASVSAIVRETHDLYAGVQSV